MPSRQDPGVRQESEDRDLPRSLPETITDSVSDAGARDISETTDTAPITDSLVHRRLWSCKFGFP